MARTLKRRLRPMLRKTLKGGHGYGQGDCEPGSISQKILRRRLAGDMFHDANNGNTLFTRILLGRYRLLFGGAYPEKGKVAYAEIVDDPGLIGLGIPTNFSEWSLFESILGPVRPTEGIPNPLGQPTTQAGGIILTNWDERRSRAICFTIDDETSYISDDSGVRLYADIANSQVGIVHDALHPVFKQLGAANLITFASILDQAPKPQAPKDNPVFYPYPLANPEVAYNLCEYGFGPFLSQLVITGFDGKSVSCKFRGLLSMNPNDTTIKEIDAITKGAPIAGHPGVKPINKTERAVSGFFTSNAEIVKVEMDVAPDMNKILYYAGKALGDTSLVMSITKNLGPADLNPMLTGDLTYIHPRADGILPTPLERYIVKTHDILEAVTAAVKDEAFILENMGSYIFIPGNDDNVPVVPADPAAAAAAAAARLLAAEKRRLTQMLTEQRNKINDSYQRVINEFSSTIGRSIYTNSAAANVIQVEPKLIILIRDALIRLQYIYFAEYTRVLALIAPPGGIPPGADVTRLSAKFKGILACKNQVLSRAAGFYFNSRIVISKTPVFGFTLDQDVLERPAQHLGHSVFVNFLNYIYTAASIYGYLTNPANPPPVQVPSLFNLLADHVQTPVNDLQLAQEYTIPPIIAPQPETDDNAVLTFIQSYAYVDDIKATVTASAAKISVTDAARNLTSVNNKLSRLKEIQEDLTGRVEAVNRIQTFEHTVEVLTQRKTRSQTSAEKQKLNNKIQEAKDEIDKLQTYVEGSVSGPTRNNIVRSATLRNKVEAKAKSKIIEIAGVQPDSASLNTLTEPPKVREKPGCFPYFQKCLKFVGSSAKKLVVMIATAYSFINNPRLTTDRVVLQNVYEEIKDGFGGGQRGGGFNGEQTGGVIDIQTGPMPWELAMINAFCCDFNANQFANLGYINGINAPPVKNYDSIIVKSFQKERDMYLSAIGMKMNAEGTSVEPLPTPTPTPATNKPLPAATIDVTRSGVVSYGKPQLSDVSNGTEENPTKQTVFGGQRVSPENRTIDATKSGVRMGGSPNVEET